ncbi:hypothetical protein ACFYZ9_33700 [Streptomyces sp. NPDC001691]|uniref:hypothetical protein n=1 Tax=Streptomyces sp. NPDC001691 TaxID=3364600 RepID=UPI0036B8FA68
MSTVENSPSGTEQCAEYTVEWDMQLDATGPVDAARRALDEINDQARIFIVTGPDGVPVDVDLSVIDGEGVDHR